jgi:hypothetical protein
VVTDREIMAVWRMFRRCAREEEQAGRYFSAERAMASLMAPWTDADIAEAAAIGVNLTELAPGYPA